VVSINVGYLLMLHVFGSVKDDLLTHIC